MNLNWFHNFTRLTKPPFLIWVLFLLSSTFNCVELKAFKGEILKEVDYYSFRNSIDVYQFDSLYRNHKLKSKSNLGLKDRERWFLYEFQYNGNPKDIVIEIPETLVDDVVGYMVNPSGKIEYFLKAGDEGKLSQKKLKIRTPAGFYRLDQKGKYTIYVKYWRNGSFPHMILKIFDLDEFIPYYSNLEFNFGFIYGIFFLYFAFTLYLGIANGNKQFLLFSLWILSNISFFVITAGHYKYFFYPELLNFNNKLRLVLVFTSAYFLIDFTLEFLNFRKELGWLDKFNKWVILLIGLFFGYLFVFPENPIEKSQNITIIFIQSLFLVIVLLVLSIPIFHYRKTKKISFLYFVILFNASNGLMFLFFAISNNPIDYNTLMFYLLILPFLEITAIAVGITQRIRQNDAEQRSLLSHNLNLQLKANQVQTEAVESERKRISTELHDDILNRLSMLLMLNRAGKIDSLSIDESLSEINNDIRSYAYRLYPPWIEDLDFFSMVKRELDALSQALDIQISYNFFDVQFEFTSLQKINTFRIMQEFVLNSKKHGLATNVNIDIYQREDSIILYLEDNGIGFDADEVTKGIGMKSVVSRVNVLGGQIEVSSKPGTSVSWMIAFPMVLRNN